MSPIRAEDSPTWQSNFQKVCDQPLSLIEFLQRSPLVDDLVVGAGELDLALEKEGFKVETHARSSQIRVGGKSVDLEGAVARQVHFDNAQHRPWIDLVRFSEEESARALMGQLSQWHSGRTDPDYRVFFTIKRDDGRDAVSAILRRGDPSPAVGKMFGTELNNLSWLNENICSCWHELRLYRWTMI